MTYQQALEAQRIASRKYISACMSMPIPETREALEARLNAITETFAEYEKASTEYKQVLEITSVEELQAIQVQSRLMPRSA